MPRLGSRSRARPMQSSKAASAFTSTVRVNGSVHVNSKIRVNRTTVGRGRFVVGRTYNGRMYFDHNRHFWNGQWYDYGVGPCWIYIDDEWFWHIAACPL
jgi:hypothetical protein